MKRALMLAGLAFAAAAQAGTRDDYVREWPLLLSRDDGGAFRIALTRDIYATAQDATLADIEVFNAAGESVPAALLGPAAALPPSAAPLTVELRWFQLPPPSDRNAAGRWDIVAERDARGRVSRINLDAAEAQPAPRRDLLIDLSQVRSPLAALRFEWKTPDASAQGRYRVEESDDLVHWHGTDIDVALADLSNADATLRRDRVTLRSTHAYAAYLRVVPIFESPLEITRVVAEIAPQPTEPAWEWLDLAGRRVEENGAAHIDYALDARVPAERVDLSPAAGNSAAEWTISSREGERWNWQHRAGPWMAYAVVAGGTLERSQPQSLALIARDRAWRADSTQPGNGAPVLRLGWRPEQIVFLAQGEGPYTLAAGSAKARRQDAPIARLVAELRARRGADWQPYPATAAAPRTLAGPQALAKPAAIAKPEPVRWESWLLWALLVGGAGIIAWMALAVLRKPVRTED